MSKLLLFYMFTINLKWIENWSVKTTVDQHLFENKLKIEANYVKTQGYCYMESPRLYGGAKANKKNWLFLVKFGFVASNNESKECEGTLLSKNWVITSGKCLYNLPSGRNVIIKVGSTNCFDDGIIYRADKVIIHPNFNGLDGNINDNIGLIYLKSKIPIKHSDIKVAKVGRGAFSVGKKCIIGSWINKKPKSLTKVVESKYVNRKTEKKKNITFDKLLNFTHDEHSQEELHKILKLDELKKKNLSKYIAIEKFIHKPKNSVVKSTEKETGKTTTDRLEIEEESTNGSIDPSPQDLRKDEQKKTESLSSTQENFQSENTPEEEAVDELHIKADENKNNEPENLEINVDETFPNRSTIPRLKDILLEKNLKKYLDLLDKVEQNLLKKNAKSTELKNSIGNTSDVKIESTTQKSNNQAEKRLKLKDTSSDFKKKLAEVEESLSRTVKEKDREFSNVSTKLTAFEEKLWRQIKLDEETTADTVSYSKKPEEQADESNENTINDPELYGLKLDAIKQEMNRRVKINQGLLDDIRPPTHRRTKKPSIVNLRLSNVEDELERRKQKQKMLRIRDFERSRKKTTKEDPDFLDDLQLFMSGGEKKEGGPVEYLKGIDSRERQRKKLVGSRPFKFASFVDDSSRRKLDPDLDFSYSSRSKQTKMGIHDLDSTDDLQGVNFKERKRENDDDYVDDLKFMNLNSKRGATKKRFNSLVSLSLTHLNDDSGKKIPEQRKQDYFNDFRSPPIKDKTDRKKSVKDLLSETSRDISNENLDATSSSEDSKLTISKHKAIGKTERNRDSFADLKSKSSLETVKDETDFMDDLPFLSFKSTTTKTPTTVDDNKKNVNLDTDSLDELKWMELTDESQRRKNRNKKNITRLPNPRHIANELKPKRHRKKKHPRVFHMDDDVRPVRKRIKGEFSMDDVWNEDVDLDGTQMRKGRYLRQAHEKKRKVGTVIFRDGKSNSRKFVFRKKVRKKNKNNRKYKNRRRNGERSAEERPIRNRKSKNRKEGRKKNRSHREDKDFEENLKKIFTRIVETEMNKKIDNLNQFRNIKFDSDNVKRKNDTNANENESREKNVFSDVNRPTQLDEIHVNRSSKIKPNKKDNQSNEEREIRRKKSEEGLADIDGNQEENDYSDITEQNRPSSDQPEEHSKPPHKKHKRKKNHHKGHETFNQLKFHKNNRSDESKANQTDAILLETIVLNVGGKDDDNNYDELLNFTDYKESKEEIDDSEDVQTTAKVTEAAIRIPETTSTINYEDDADGVTNEEHLNLNNINLMSYLNVKDYSEYTSDIFENEVTIVDPHICEIIFSISNTDNHIICTTTSIANFNDESYTMDRDCGGPLICDGKLVGVHSVGNYDKDKSFEIFIRVDFYEKWIRKLFKEHFTPETKSYSKRYRIMKHNKKKDKPEDEKTLDNLLLDNFEKDRRSDTAPPDNKLNLLPAILYVIINKLLIF